MQTLFKIGGGHRFCIEISIRFNSDSHLIFVVKFKVHFDLRPETYFVFSFADLRCGRAVSGMLQFAIVGLQLTNINISSSQVEFRLNNRFALYLE